VISSRVNVHGRDPLHTGLKRLDQLLCSKIIDPYVSLSRREEVRLERVEGNSLDSTLSLLEWGLGGVLGELMYQDSFGGS
jgi:hypothetical protein